MDPAKRILASLVSASQNVQAITAEYANAKDARQVRGYSLIRLEMKLRAIAAVCKAVLEILDDPLPSRQWMLDDRLIDWLSGTEPETCLKTLNEMQDLLKIDRCVTVQLLNSREFMCPKEEAIVSVVTLFDSCKAHFHFLLTGDIWNYEMGPSKRNLLTNSKPDNIAGEITQSQPQHPSISSCMMSEDENRRKRETVGQKLNKLLHFLDPLYCTTKQRETSSLRRSDTCKWLCLTEEYKAWRDGYESFLLLQGKRKSVGAGKTVLASSVIAGLLETKHKEEFLAYFYCDFRIGRSTSAVEVMRSILAQLVSSFCAIVAEPEDLLNDLLKDTNNNVELFYNVKSLSRYHSKVAKLCPRKPLIVVDALDECREMGALLDGLIMTNGDVQTFVTSRPLQNVIAKFSCFPTISMDRMANELSADISLHVTRELDSRCRLRTLEGSLKAGIKSKLCAKADGMFRWVQCQIDALDKCTSVSEIRRALESLPEGLEETYRRILIAIDRCSPDARIVRRALVWLVTALRPMRMDELLEAVMIDPYYRALDSRFKLLNGTDLLRVCRSLVVHHGETDIITLSHMSVKEYLVGELVRAKLPWYHIVMENVHERLARLCIGYIAFCLEETKEPSSVTRQRRIVPTTIAPRPRPFLKYVLSYGFGHFSHLGPDNAGIFEDLKSLQVLILRHTREWDQLCNMVPSVHSGIPWPTSRHDFTLYILVAFASDALLRTYVSSAALTPRKGTNPLVYAAYLGKTEHSRVLISQGVDINLGGLIVDTMATRYSDVGIMDVDHLGEGDSDSDMSDVGDDPEHETTPLEAAVDRWHVEIVDLLFAVGCVVPDRLLARVLGKRPHHFPLYIISRLLQTCGFEKWVTTPWEYRGLLEVIVDDAEDHGEDDRDELLLVLRRLVEVGFAEALLLLAVEKGCISIVEALLSMNTSSTMSYANALAPNGDTLLHLAIRLSDENQCLTITKLLVEAGCDPCVLDADDKPPVHLAVVRGLILVVGYLLSQNVPLPSRILFAALQATLVKRVEMIRLLISRGANIHVLSPDGYSLLHVAMRSSDESVFPEIALVLSNAGCNNPSTSERCGKTALGITPEQGCRAIAKYLLQSVTSSDILSLMNPNCLIQEVALKSLVRKPNDLHFQVEADDTLLHAVNHCLDDEYLHLALAKKVLAVHDGLLLWDIHLFESAVQRGFCRVVEYLLSEHMSLPRGILVTALRHQAWMVPFLIEKGADVHFREVNGDTLLHVTIRSISVESQRYMVLQALVEAGCSISHVNAAGEPPLYTAVTHGFISVAKYFLSLAPHDGSPDPFSTVSPLHPARSFLLGPGTAHVDPAGNGLLHRVITLSSDEEACLEVICFLTSTYRHRHFAPNASHETPLHIAIKRRFASVGNHLISLGAPVSPDVLPLTLQSWPVAGGNTLERWKSLFDSLVLRGVDVHWRSTYGDTLMHLAVRLDSRLESLEATNLLIEAGCTLCVPNVKGKLPLQIAVEYGPLFLVEYLLSHDTPLPHDILFTALEGRAEIPPMVSLLARHGANLSARDTNGDSVLHLTLSCDRLSRTSLLQAVKMLIRMGCDPHACNSKGRTPLEIATANGHFKAERYLRTLVL